MKINPFHLAIPVYDPLPRVISMGRCSAVPRAVPARRVDFDFFGHQLVIHEHPKTASQDHAHTNAVDGHDVPVPHFGVVLDWDRWIAGRSLACGGNLTRDRALHPLPGAGGRTGNDVPARPCGNALEFKAFKDMGQLFAK